jgi:hypothetical protein
MPAYSHHSLMRIVSTLAIMLASVFPIASILVLYKVQSMENRLYAIIGFTILFAACVVAFSLGKRVETFAATMA